MMMTTTISAEEISNNIDLLTEILVRIPVKPVVTFKSVSKQWLCLISDPQFCLLRNRHHHNHSPYLTPTALLLKEDISFSPEFEIVPLKQYTIPQVPFFYYLNAHNFRVRQSCNGLLLCLLYQHMRKFNYCICNPTISQFKILSFPSCESKDLLISICMAFNPLKSNHYKVICIRRLKNTDKCQIDMYYSETDSWKPLDNIFTPPTRIEFVDAVFCKGAVHWYIDEKSSLYFDVDRECLNTMPMPNLAQRQVRYFGESWGYLHLIVNKCHYPSQLDVMEMATDYSGWFVRYHVNLDAMSFSVLHVIRAQKEEDSIIVIYVGNKAISYNVHNGTSKKLCDLEPHRIEGSLYYTWLETSPYFEILNSV